LLLGWEGIQAWKATHGDFRSRIIAVRLLVKDAKGKDIYLFLVSYSPIGAVSIGSVSLITLH